MKIQNWSKMAMDREREFLSRPKIIKRCSAKRRHVISSDA